MIFAVLDPSPLTVCINCSFLHLYYYNQEDNIKVKASFYRAARFYASAVYAVVVCPFVCLSQAGTVPKRLIIDHANNVI